MNMNPFPDHLGRADLVPVAALLTPNQLERLDAITAAVVADDSTIDQEDVVDAIFEAGLAWFEANTTKPASAAEYLMNINIKKLHPTAVAPSYATPGAGCFDLYATDVNGSHRLGSNVDPGFPVTCGTGLAFEVPEGWVMLLMSRSGHGFCKDTRLANCVGVVDSDYRGEVFVKLTADDDAGRAGGDHEAPMHVMPGDRVAQALLVPAKRVQFTVVDELSETERGCDGFGSTGER